MLRKRKHQKGKNQRINYVPNLPLRVQPELGLKEGVEGTRGVHLLGDPKVWV